jgi:hypothetical protein
MRKTIPLFICATLVLTGCARLSESRINPLNWFGGSQPLAASDPSAEKRPLVGANERVQIIEQRVPIETITSVSLNRTPEGAILTATGMTAAQGYFNAQLVPVTESFDKLTFSFRAQPSPGQQDVGPVATRQITAARVITNAELRFLREIRVESMSNARTLRP